VNGIDYKRPVLVSQSLLIRRSAQFRSCRSKRWECTEATYIGGIIPILLKQEEQENDADNPVRLMVGAAAPREYFILRGRVGSFVTRSCTRICRCRRAV
jgi:hypothetical protein